MTSQPPAADRPEPLAWLRRLVRGVSIGCAALFAVIACVRLAGIMPPQDRLVLTPLAVAVACANAAAYLFLPGFVVSVGLERIARDGESPRNLLSVQERLTELFAGSRIVGLLFCGGSTVFLSVGFLVEGQWFVPPLAGLTLIGTALQYPTAAAEAGWMAEQRRRIERLKDAGL